MDNKELLLFNDLKKEYQCCMRTCRIILRANQLNINGFVFYRYIDFESIFQLREKNKLLKTIKLINLIHPSSKEYSQRVYESFWIDSNNPTTLNIVTSFATVYISNKVYIHTLPVWQSFLRKLIRLFRGIRVNNIRF